VSLDLRLDRQAGVPLTEQLAAHIRSHVAAGRLPSGERLPSLREAAVAAGVNVNTVRAAYALLERDGVVRSEQGRGTFVASPARSEAATRRELRRQIERLEAELVRVPQPPAARPARPSGAAPGLLTTQELTSVRDRLVQRLSELDAARAEVLRRLDQLGADVPASPSPLPARRGSTPSLSGARVRWHFGGLARG
jgi:DNA-binding transcriptional regulator YhcF (GntR family)